MHDNSSGLIGGGTTTGLEPFATAANDLLSLGATLKCLTGGATWAVGGLRVAFRGCFAMLATSSLPLHLIFERPSSISSGFTTHFTWARDDSHQEKKVGTEVNNFIHTWAMFGILAEKIADKN
ncbi:hypothetical protein LXL04_006183 [Taraxacum kok-saghyz]